MKFSKLLLLLAVLFFAQCDATKKAASANPYQSLAAKRVQLPNQWMLTPAGEIQRPLGDLPLQIAVSPFGNWLAVTNNGVGVQKLQLFRARDGVQFSEVEIPKAWYGLAFNLNGSKLYASGGNDNLIAIYKIDNQQLVRDGEIKLGEPWPVKICPAGLALDEANNRLLAVTKEDNSLYVCNLSKRAVEQKIPLGSEVFAVVVSEKRNEIFVSLWGAKKVLVFDRKTLAPKGEIAVGDHPNEMVLNKKQDLLYVANSHDNSVSVVDLPSMKTLEVLNCALFPDAPNGSTTNSLSLSFDDKALYVANADNNCLAVFDITERGESKPLGFIPTGWYPTSVRTVGFKIFVANGKGMSSLPNPQGPSPFHKAADERAAQYIGELYLGTLSVINTPSKAALAAYSKLVYENCPYTKAKEMQAEGEAGNPVPMRVGDPSPIKYVFYIIKENRTYDQVLGDLPEGNGDPALCLFPEKITPNQHALAREFVLLDNFYVDAEVSADGHNWSTAAYANDFVEKTWPTSYGGRGGKYDYEGTRKVAHPKDGFIWDFCKRAGVSYRTYGEFADDNKANYETLEGHFCPGYSSWDLSYQDIRRQADWQRDFDSLLAINQLARFNTIRFGNNHTSGLAKGAYSPNAAVADNDLAVGRFIEHLSHSKIWKESAVFILEDDAQNGADHVDAHRSIAFVVSPFIKRKFVDHTMYSTSSMLRTMELILGLPPMSQYDAAATPMWRCFTSTPDFTPVKALPARVDIEERNLAANELSRISGTFNLAQVDAVPDRLFNEVLWKAIKGEDSEMPAPRRAAWVMVGEEEDED
ncbi:MAG: bifunctional YncE family protein/alkaline phosphatase family protein [Bacteroidetes bacterium]|nr:bifunctional YncE family protein/alkaline phosphatase family protein [Bacteroidota bacterium]